MNDQRHNKEYNTSAATAEPLDSEDSLTSNLLYDDVTARSNCSSNNNNKKIVIIEGLELLGIDTDGEYEYDEYDNEDERKEEEKEEYHYENYGECSSELDSLVLARKRLHHIWINHPERHHWNRRVFPHEKVSLQETSTSIPDLEPIDLGTSSSAEGKDDGNKKPNDEDDDDDDYSWDALSQMTVDSLILTRKRFAAQRARRYRTTRKQGTDLIFLMPTTNYNNKKKKNSGIATGGNHHLQSRRIVTTKKPQVVRMARILRSHRCRTSPSVLLRTHSDTLIRLAQQQGRGGGGGTVAGAASELQRSTSYHSRSPSRTSSFSSFTGDNNNRRH